MTRWQYDLDEECPLCGDEYGTNVVCAACRELNIREERQSLKDMAKPKRKKKRDRE